MHKFYIGWHQINAGNSGTMHFDRCLISANRLLTRRAKFPIKHWILDNGGFSRFLTHGCHLPVDTYCDIVERWHHNGSLDAVVTQDWLCTDSILKTTGLSILAHQQLTIDRYDLLLKLLPSVYLMPVLQGRKASDYVRHLEHYAYRLAIGQWVGVGSIARLAPAQIGSILLAIKSVRPDLKIHGFGVKYRALKCSFIWDLLYSADSQSHGLTGGSGKLKYLNSNDPLSALSYARSIQRPVQLSIFNC
jgi:hypothetical protein